MAMERGPGARTRSPSTASRGAAARHGEPLMDASLAAPAADDGATEPARPLLTVCTPTYQRPELLRRALESILAQAGPRMREVELVVSDNSTTDESEEIATAILARWPGPTRYARNRPPLDMIANHNRCIELATGASIVFLHDDDLHLPGGIDAVLDVLERPGAAPVHLFGVDVVRMDGRLRRRQHPHRDEQLTPAQALRRLLTDSSFVRLPGVVASAEAYRGAGQFDELAGNAIDLDMWVRLFARHGLHTVPHGLAAYTVHGAALTSGMFTPEVVARLVRIFERASGLGVLDAGELRRAETRWFHKFVLAGAYRALETGDRAGAAEILDLFSLPSLRQLGTSLRWLPVRAAFWAITLGARRRPAAERTDPRS
jgi:glycosyltransferase involved in cell wall biosynthesis